MPKKLHKSLLRPLKSKSGVAGDIGRAAQLVQSGRALAEQLRQSGHATALPTAEELTPDHVFSLAFGFEKARQLLDRELEPRRQLAAQRRGKVLEMTIAGRKVTEIAAAVKLRPDYVVKVRARLRNEGKLPRL